MKLTVGSCFSGIGGLELGLEWTGGFETRWQIENDPYASAVLAKHWPHVARHGDIRNVGRSCLEPVDVICGGFPCQDVSLAGARAGLEGQRSTLWGEMFRLVCEVKPRWVVAENVPGLLSSDGGRFFGNILRDLAKAGYDAEWGMLSACAFGFPHTRERVFIMAYTGSARGKRWGKSTGKERETEVGESDSGAVTRSIQASLRSAAPDPFCRVAYGISKKVAFSMLGNAVVPQVAQKVGEMILRIHHGT